MIAQIGEADNLSRNLREKLSKVKVVMWVTIGRKKEIVINTYVWQSDTEGDFRSTVGTKRNHEINLNIKQRSLLSKKLP